jgi:CelD/BcsL family acetyltransferase involved in cellulose biosynthesis
MTRTEESRRGTLQGEGEQRGIASSTVAATAIKEEDLSVEIHQGVAALDRLTPEWNELCESGPDDLPFYRPEWTRAYVRSFAPQGKLLILTVRCSGRLVAVMPLLREWRRFYGLPVQTLRSPINYYVLAFSLVRRTEPEGEVAMRALWKHLAALGNWDMIKLSAVRVGGAVERLVETVKAGGFTIATLPWTASSFISVPESEEGLDRIPRSARLRQRLRQIARELSDRSIELLISSDVRDNDDLLKRFYVLESSGWKGQRATAIASHAESQQFWDDIAEYASQSRYLRLYGLELDGNLVAGLFGLQYRGRTFLPKIAFNEDYAQYSPGQLLMTYITRDSKKNGMIEIDILGTPSGWNSRWTSESHAMVEYLIFNKTLWGRLLHYLAYRVRPAIKRALRRDGPPVKTSV